MMCVLENRLQDICPVVADLEFQHIVLVRRREPASRPLQLDHGRSDVMGNKVDYRVKTLGIGERLECGGDAVDESVQVLQGADNDANALDGSDVHQVDQGGDESGANQ